MCYNVHSALGDKESLLFLLWWRQEGTPFDLLPDSLMGCHQKSKHWLIQQIFEIENIYMTKRTQNTLTTCNSSAQYFVEL